ncbi:MFS transporter [Jatrophihabitans sp.]|uniref:MFS transporter n=1 Tax=Jatrophihabitans sp. TaxID=1932789 RepID=UPI002CFBF4FD|nr:MFS transporter [Jatrophihabitans sp.]
MRRPVAATPLGHNRDFLILWTGEAVSALGTSMSVLVFPLIGYAITGSPAQAGLATTAVLLGEVVARLPAGALVDRWPRGRVLLLSYLVGAGCYGSLAVATLAGALTLAHLVGIGFVSGVTDSFVAPAASAAVRTVVAEPDLPVAYTQLQIRGHAADLVGPPLGGALYSVARGLPFLFDTVSYLVGALAITRLRTPLPAPDRVRRPVLADVAEGLRFVWRHAVVRAILLWGAVLNFAVTLALVSVTLRLVRAGVHPSAIGLVDSIAAASGVLGALVAPAIISRFRTSTTTAVTSLLLAAVMVPMAWTDRVPVIGALLAFGIFLLPAANSGISAYLVTVTPDRLQGRVNSAGGFIAGGVVPLAPVLAGVLIGWAGGRVATLVGAACVALSLVPLLSSSAIRGLGRPGSWSATELPAEELPAEELPAEQPAGERPGD